MFRNQSQILVPLDGSSLAEGVLPHVVALSRILHGPITLVRVVERQEDSGAVDPLTWQIRKTEADAYLAEVAQRLRALDLQVTTQSLEGQPAERIVHYASEHDIGLIVISSHGRSGLSEWNISSVVQKVILRAYAPVLVIRAYRVRERELDSLRYSDLMVPLDGSQRAECVLPLATTIAREHNARLIAAHIVRRPEVPRRKPLSAEEQELIESLVALNRAEAESYLDNLSSRVACAVDTRLLVADSPAVALHQLTKEESVDLTLICAHGYSGEAQWPYGSIALSFIAYGTTPLLVVQDMPAEEVGRSAAAEAASETRGH